MIGFGDKPLSPFAPRKFGWQCWLQQLELTLDRGIDKGDQRDARTFAERKATMGESLKRKAHPAKVAPP